MLLCVCIAIHTVCSGMMLQWRYNSIKAKNKPGLSLLCFYHFPVMLAHYVRFYVSAGYIMLALNYHIAGYFRKIKFSKTSQ